MLWFGHCAAWNPLSQPCPGTGCGFTTGESRQALLWWERVRDAPERSWDDPAGTASCLPGTAGHGGSLPTGVVGRPLAYGTQHLSLLGSCFLSLKAPLEGHQCTSSFCFHFLFYLQALNILICLSRPLVFPCGR